MQLEQIVNKESEASSLTNKERKYLKLTIYGSLVAHLTSVFSYISINYLKGADTASDYFLNVAVPLHLVMFPVLIGCAVYAKYKSRKRI